MFWVISFCTTYDARRQLSQRRYVRKIPFCVVSPPPSMFGVGCAYVGGTSNPLFVQRRLRYVRKNPFCAGSPPTMMFGVGLAYISTP